MTDPDPSWRQAAEQAGAPPALVWIHVRNTWPRDAHRTRPDSPQVLDRVYGDPDLRQRVVASIDAVADQLATERAAEAARDAELAAARTSR